MTGSSFLDQISQPGIYHQVETFRQSDDRNPVFSSVLDELSEMETVPVSLPPSHPGDYQAADRLACCVLWISSLCQRSGPGQWTDVAGMLKHILSDESPGSTQYLHGIQILTSLKRAFDNYGIDYESVTFPNGVEV